MPRLLPHLHQVWEVEGEAAGTVTTAGPLTFLTVDAAGHMVPMDQPKVCVRGRVL